MRRLILQADTSSFDRLIERNNKITAKNFEYYSVLNKWLMGLQLRIYSPSQKDEYPSNKVTF